MVFLIGKNFSLSSGREHRKLKFSQLTFVPVTDREPEKLKRSTSEDYANDEEPAMCLVRLYKKYLERCPKTAVQGNNKSTNEVWFTSTPVGHKKIGNVVRKMCKDAGLQGQFSNRSLRAKTATRGLEKGISDKLIVERTGYRDIRSLQRHQRSNISKALNCRSEGSVGEREAESSLKREVDQLLDDE
ncbi:hypothetical protein P5673_032672, partial [Acropora cervicornis]